MKTKRNIIKIDEGKCNGCGLCVCACAEGAIKIINGKAKLISESFCDGLGACLGECPTGALIIEERVAQEFSKDAIKAHLEKSSVPFQEKPKQIIACACPGSAQRTIPVDTTVQIGDQTQCIPSQLGSWPVQIMLVSPTANFLRHADLLVAADCAPFAVPDFHATYLRGRIPLVGCPKLDDIEYYNSKLCDIIEHAEPSSITVLRMEVPCCAGIARAVTDACERVGCDVPVEIVTVKTNGETSRKTVPSPVLKAS